MKFKFSWINRNLPKIIVKFESQINQSCGNRGLINILNWKFRPNNSLNIFRARILFPLRRLCWISIDFYISYKKWKYVTYFAMRTEHQHQILIFDVLENRESFHNMRKYSHSICFWVELLKPCDLLKKILALNEIALCYRIKYFQKKHWTPGSSKSWNALKLWMF